MNPARLFALMGPGIVWAATSIGVSHIVQATRAGADFGFALLGFVLLAHVIKYPFFLFGPRYAALTGKSLLDGYRNIGGGALYLFLALTLVTMFFVQAGVTIVTAALASNLFGNFFSVGQWSAAILLLVATILLVGHYKLLNSSLKVMMMLFALLSIIALIAAIARLGPMPAQAGIDLDLGHAATIAFIVALMGWMPTSIEVSVWHSLWTLSRFKTFGRDSARHAVLDFNIGFVTSLILAGVFVWLGALLMFGSGASFANAAAAFAGQLIELYSSALGPGSWWLIASISFIALFSTTFAVADGFPQVWKRAYTLIIGGEQEQRVYTASLLLLLAVAGLIVSVFASDIKTLLDFVTTVSFVSAPIYAWFNYRVIMSLEEEFRPSGWFKVYTLGSLALLTGFSLFFVYWRFF